jgi:hypothetical protein
MRVMGAMVELTQVYNLAVPYFMGNLLARPSHKYLTSMKKAYITSSYATRISAISYMI